MKYFCYDPECGFEKFNNESEAKACAEEYLNAARENTDDGGWHESVNQICWGKVIGVVAQVKTGQYRYTDFELVEEKQ